MRFKIAHQLKYRYSRPVFLEPHTFYLRPREHDAQKLTDFVLSIQPQPVMSSWFTDVFGNRALRVWFEGKHGMLDVTTDMQVDTFRKNPFNYLPDERYSAVRLGYPKPITAYLQPYVQADVENVSLGILQYAENVSVRCGNQITTFLPELCHQIYEEFKKTENHSKITALPEDTLRKKEGSCRDLAMFFIACCDSLSLAARFVSGYFAGDPDIIDKDLHGWAEVYIEGGGWRGFDPSTGLAINESYIPVASSPVPKLVSPSIGTFRGDRVECQFLASIQIQNLNVLQSQ